MNPFEVSESADDSATESGSVEDSATDVATGDDDSATETGSVEDSATDVATGDTSAVESPSVRVAFCIDLQFPLLWLFHTLFGNIEQELCPVYDNALCGPIASAGAECDITQCGFNCNTMGGTNANGHSEEDAWNSDGTVDAAVVNESNLSGTVGCFRVCIEMMFETEDIFVAAMGGFKKNLPAGWSFDVDHVFVDALAAVEAAAQ